jgi:hypothetical protein
VHFEFKVEERATHYTVVNTGDSRGSLDLASATYAWKFTPPDNDPACNNRGVLTGTGKEFVWRHGNKGDSISDDACNHDIGLPGSGHTGDVDVTVKDAKWSCTAGYTGTQAADGSPTGNGTDGDCVNIAPPPVKARDCDVERAALAAANAEVDARNKALDEFEPRRREQQKQLKEAWEQLIAAETTVIAGYVDFVKHALPFVKVAKERVDDAVKVDIEMEATFRRLYKEYEAALAARRRAEKALAACLGDTVRRSQAVQHIVDCRQQRIAAARAQALLSVYRSVSRSVQRVDLAGARTKLLDAKKLIVRARSVSGGGTGEVKLDQRLSLAGVSAGRAADAVGALLAANARLAAKVKPAQKQVTAAKAALAACQK